MPRVGDLIKFKSDGFDNLPYIDQGVGFVEFITEDPQKGFRIKVHIFNKTRYKRKNLMEIEIGPSQEEYSLADFDNFFKVIK